MVKSTLLLAVAAVVATGCSIPKLLSTEDAEKQISDSYATRFPVEKVTCPAKIPLKVGEKFVCQIRFKGATEDLALDGVITSTTSSGGKFDAPIREPFLDPKPAAAWIAEEIEKQKGVKATVDCGPPRRPAPVDTCIAKADDGSSRTVEIKVGTDGKPTSFEVK